MSLQIKKITFNLKEWRKSLFKKNFRTKSNFIIAVKKTKSTSCLSPNLHSLLENLKTTTTINLDWFLLVMPIVSSPPNLENNFVSRKLGAQIFFNSTSPFLLECKKCPPSNRAQDIRQREMGMEGEKNKQSKN